MATQARPAVAVPFVTTGTYPTRHGNRVRPWIDGEPAFRRICEAIEAAQHRVWATVTFMWPSFQMPDGRGTALDVLDRATRRGVDVRLIFWRPEEAMSKHRRNAFWGSPDHFKVLSQYDSRLKIRWDRAAPGYCQHQKTWLIDAGETSATTFVGGINLNPHSLVAPGHRGDAGQNHDIYVELTGPATADVQHNFVQRWNEASERASEHGRWGNDGADELRFPPQVPPECGTASVQIQRTTHQGLYLNGHPPPGGAPFDVATGERTNLEQYCAAISSARRTIYMENQYVEVADIVAALDHALARGVQVIMLLPAVPDISSQTELTEERIAFLNARGRLAVYENFTMAGIAALGTNGRRQPIYVHAKLMLIDDAWATVGSCNLHRYSLFGNGELNVAIQDPVMVRALRSELFAEHLAVDTAEMEDVAALRLFSQIARANRQRHEQRDPYWQGLAFSLNPQTYGQKPQF